MASIDKVKDDELRGRLQEARDQMKARNPTDAVHTIADAFLSMLAMKPEMVESTVPGRAGRRMNVLMRWPMLGANFVQGSVRDGKPEIEFIRDHFAMSEAITYFEFTVDTAIAQGL